MLLPFLLFHIVMGLLAHIRRHESLAETIPYHFDGQRRRMRHIGTVEPVVAQLVEHYLVGGEVIGIQLIYSQQQRGFAKLVTMGSVGQMAYRAYGEQYREIRIERLDFLQQRAPERYNLTLRHPTA